MDLCRAFCLEDEGSLECSSSCRGGDVLVLVRECLGENLLHEFLSVRLFLESVRVHSSLSISKMLDVFIVGKFCVVLMSSHDLISMELMQRLLLLQSSGNCGDSVHAHEDHPCARHMPYLI